MDKQHNQGDDTDFALRCQQIRQQLEEDRVKAVGLWLDNADQFACVLLACLNAKVNVLLPPNLLNENLEWLEKHSALLFDKKMVEQFGRLQKIQKIQPLLDKQNESEIWLKTSGSSGQAKIIHKTARQMWVEAEALAAVLPFNANEQISVIGSVSLQHLYGLTFRIFLPLQMGWKLGGEQLHYPEYLLAESRHYRTLWISSPALLSHLNLASLDQHVQIAGIISSGGALPEQTALALREELPCPVIEIYGSTETGAIAFRQQTGGLWQAMPNTRLGLNDEEALWVENAWIVGREQTADAVQFSEHGFELLGRIDRIIKLSDKRLSLVKMEQDLLKHCFVQDCYIALHCLHQRPLAWVALNKEGIAYFKQQGRKAVISQFRQHLRLTQEKFALPRYWRFTDNLPRNNQSKISRLDFEKICTALEYEVFA